MTNDELIQKVLTGVRENYKQNLQILKELEAIKKSVGTVETTHQSTLATHSHSPKKDWNTIGKPKDENGNVIEQNTNSDTKDDIVKI